MRSTIPNSRFIVSSLHESYAGVLCGLLSRYNNIYLLGNHLITKAEESRSFRRSDDTLVYGALLSLLPIREYRLAGQYYMAWSEFRKGSDINISYLTQQSHPFQAKAITLQASVYARQRDTTSEYNSYKTACDLAPNLRMKVESLHGQAVALSKMGEGRKSLDLLNSIVPFFSKMPLLQVHDCMNGIAVELLALGHIREAHSISSVVRESPYLLAYPEWSETYKEITHFGSLTVRSYIVVPRLPLNEPSVSNVIKMADWIKRTEPDKFSLVENKILHVWEYLLEADIPIPRQYRILNDLSLVLLRKDDAFSNRLLTRILCKVERRQQS